MRVTACLFEAGIKCLTKCFFRSIGERGAGNAYADWVRTQSVSYNREGIKRLITQAAHHECIRGVAATKNLKTAEWRFAVDFVARSKNLESTVHAVERIPFEGPGKSAHFIPLRFIFSNKLTRDDKLLLAFDALVLSEMLDQEISLGKIIHGDNHSTSKIRIFSLTREVRKLIRRIDALVSG